MLYYVIIVADNIPVNSFISMRYARIPTFLICAFLPFISWGQSDTTFLNSKEKKTTSAKATAYQIHKKTGEVYDVTTYYMSGEKRSDCVYLSLEPEVRYGNFTSYDISGKKLSEGKYADNRPEGKWLYYFAGTDRLKKTESYKNGMLDGLVLEYDSVSGKKALAQTYKTNVLNGKYNIYNPVTGLLKMEFYCKGGVPNGHMILYDSVSGHKMREGDLVDNKRDGEWAFYYEDTAAVRRRTEYVNGIRHGKHRFFHKSGRPEEIVTYDNGRILTQVVGYHDKDSLVAYTIDFKNGRRDGDIIYYDSATGKVTMKGQYLSGFRRDKWLFYYPETGKSRGYQIYNFSGRLNGESEEYFASGKVKERVEFLNGDMVRSRTLYYEDGSVAVKETFPGTRGYSVLQFFDSATHKVMTKGEQQQGDRTGIWYYYIPGTDTLKHKVPYKDGMVHGQWVSYYANGTKNVEGQFNNGMRADKLTLYYKETGKKWAQVSYADSGNNEELFVYYENAKLKRHELRRNDTIVKAECYTFFGKDTAWSPLYSKAAFDGEVSTFIGNELKYPPAAKAEKKEGKVQVTFVVNEDGSLSDIAVTKTLSKECDEEAMRIVKAMPKWKPEQYDGKPVRSMTSVPIVFWINEGDD